MIEGPWQSTWHISQSPILGIQSIKNYLYIFQPSLISVYESISLSMNRILEIHLPLPILNYSFSSNYIGILTQSGIEVRDRKQWEKIVYYLKTDKVIGLLVKDEQVIVEHVDQAKTHLKVINLSTMNHFEVEIGQSYHQQNIKRLDQRLILIKNMGRINDIYVYQNQTGKIESGIFLDLTNIKKQAYKIGTIASLKAGIVKNMFQYQVQVEDYSYQPSYVILVTQWQDQKSIDVIIHQILPIIDKCKQNNNHKQQSIISQLINQQTQNNNADNAENNLYTIFEGQQYKSSYLNGSSLWICSQSSICQVIFKKKLKVGNKIVLNINKWKNNLQLIGLYQGNPIFKDTVLLLKSKQYLDHKNKIFHKFTQTNNLTHQSQQTDDIWMSDNQIQTEITMDQHSLNQQVQLNKIDLYVQQIQILQEILQQESQAKPMIMDYAMNTFQNRHQESGVQAIQFRDFQTQTVQFEFEDYGSQVIQFNEFCIQTQALENEDKQYQTDAKDYIEIKQIENHSIETYVGNSLLNINIQGSSQTNINEIAHIACQFENYNQNKSSQTKILQTQQKQIQQKQQQIGNYTQTYSQNLQYYKNDHIQIQWNNIKDKKSIQSLTDNQLLSAICFPSDGYMQDINKKLQIFFNKFEQLLTNNIKLHQQINIIIKNNLNNNLIKIKQQLKQYSNIQLLNPIIQKNLLQSKQQIQKLFNSNIIKFIYQIDKYKNIDYIIQKKLQQQNQNINQIDKCVKNIINFYILKEKQNIALVNSMKKQIDSVKRSFQELEKKIGDRALNQKNIQERVNKGFQELAQLMRLFDQEDDQENEERDEIQSENSQQEEQDQEIDVRRVPSQIGSIINSQSPSINMHYPYGYHPYVEPQHTYYPYMHPVYHPQNIPSYQIPIPKHTQIPPPPPHLLEKKKKQGTKKR